MTDAPRFILGFGENLTGNVVVQKGGSKPAPPYDIETARSRVATRTAAASRAADLLPASACPGDEVVAAVALHPTYLAKSYYPDALLRSAGFEAVGSRPVEIVPEMVGRRLRTDDGPIEIQEPGEAPLPSTELFVATTRSNLRTWAARLDGRQTIEADDELVRIENIRLPAPNERIRLSPDAEGPIVLEVVLHSGRDEVVDAFQQLARSASVTVDLQRRFDAGGVCFLAASGDAADVDELADFSFLRVVRAMPSLRRPALEEVTRSATAEKLYLPTDPPVDPSLRVAVFDGGLPADSCLEPWATAYEFPGMGKSSEELTDHGHAVTSALLFGSVDADDALPRPYAHVDHFRVLDDGEDGQPDPFELYDVLGRIERVLRSGTYDFANLSLGPKIPIEDDEIHAWTAVLDQVLDDGSILASIAVGNDGHLDREAGLARIQPPSDCVNALAVGASNRSGPEWARAPYSSIGPGRSPGLTKPDLLAFGGSGVEPFVVVGQDVHTAFTGGTSFASPSALRLGLGVRAMFGPRIRPLAIKSLLIHTAEAGEGLERSEVGWGRVSGEVGDITLCGDGEARVLYQGEMIAGKRLRARLPIPDDLPNGFVTIRATLCYATAVDPQDPGNYTRSGLDVTFRPHSEKFDPKSKGHHAKSTSFFKESDFETEATLRANSQKWETVLTTSKRMRASSLHEPVFDIHHNAREAGHAYAGAPPIRYAMVITVEMSNLPELYEEVLSQFSVELQPLEPVVDLPITVST